MNPFSLIVSRLRRAEVSPVTTISPRPSTRAGFAQQIAAARQKFCEVLPALDAEIRHATDCRDSAKDLLDRATTRWQAAVQAKAIAVQECDGVVRAAENHLADSAPAAIRRTMQDLLDHREQLQTNAQTFEFRRDPGMHKTGKMVPAHDPERQAAIARALALVREAESLLTYTDADLDGKLGAIRREAGLPALPAGALAEVV